MNLGRRQLQRTYPPGTLVTLGRVAPSVMLVVGYVPIAALTGVVVATASWQVMLLCRNELLSFPWVMLRQASLADDWDAVSNTPVR